MDKVNQDFYISEFLDLSKYHFAKTTLGQDWDKFIEFSPQGTVFSSSSFLKGINKKIEMWKCLKNGQWVGVILVGESDDGYSAELIPYVVHAGIMFAPFKSNQSTSQIHSESFRILAASIRHLTSTYKNIDLSLSPQINDLRPFLWYNYGSKEPKFNLNLRYTSVLNLSGSGLNVPISENKIYNQCNKSRRQEIRYGITAGLTVKRIDCISTFLSLYEATFDRQNIHLDNLTQATVKNICIALNTDKNLLMFGTFTKDCELVSINIFSTDVKRAYFLFGANDPKFRDSFSGTTCLWRSLNLLSDMGIKEVDLEGINSPERGYFKLSFGGSIVPYYRVSLSS